MKDQYNHKYDDIINLPHPTSKKHPRMSLYARAAQFSPFAALTGHEAAIKETVRQTDAKQVLSEEVIAELNKKLYLIAETIGTQQMVEITYFVPDAKKNGGAYITCSGCVKKIDKYKHTVVMTDQTIIPIEQISLLKRKNDVEIIQVDTIPVNLLLHTEKIPIYRKKMESEDILVMLSDGAFDGFSQNGLEMAARYLKEMDVVRPQAIADGLYEQITTNKEFEKRDDMTIMVLGIWDRY